MAVFMNMAKIVGAGPLIVMLTEVLGLHKSKPAYSAFMSSRVATETPDVPTGISRFCGTDTGRCPPGLKVGDPISPDTGYRSDALERITGGQIDPSGNIWLTNNWKLDANPIRNPFGNAIVIAIGAAGPLKTPLIGPPVPFR